jgi:hypothetical protein
MLKDSTAQQRWPQQNKPSHGQPKSLHSQSSKTQVQQQQQQQKQPSSSSKKTPQFSQTSVSSSPAELPETFGLPSNSSSSAKFPKAKFNASSSDSQTKINTSQSEILIDESLSTSTKTLSTTASNVLSPKMSNGTHSSDTKQSEASSSMNSDIEIISETSSSSTVTNQNQSATSALVSTNTFMYNSDETFKNYLSKTYNNGLKIASKPQSNFVSNLSCINQILNQLKGEKTNYFENKLKRYKPYSNVKPKDILELDEEGIEDDDDDDEDDEDEEGEDEESKEKKRIKRLKKQLKVKKVIIIDDTNEEMHKPWITPELIKLIKHRNLLQAKITENNLNISTAEIPATNADVELIKKFKNLRNKVTKLVKKARSK